MAARGARIEKMEPKIAEAVGDADLAAEGTRAIRGVMAVTELEVAGMMRRVQADVARLEADADAIARGRVTDQREELAAVRRDLARKAVAVASGFEELLSLLDEADSRLAAEPAPAGSSAPAEALPRPHLRLAEAPVADEAPDDPRSQGGPPAPATAPADTEAGQPRRRWWQRWLRQAA